MVQYISHSNAKYSQLEGIKLALEGGCKWIQLRMKDAGDEEILESGRIALSMCREFNAKLIIDDKVHLVESIGADGVHLGKNDMSIRDARRILGPDKIIGGTANTYDDIKRLVADGIDYIGCGPFRFTTTKQKLSPVIGLEGYREIAEKMKNDGIDIPVVAIGGITAEDICEIKACGPYGIALSGAVLNAENPEEEMKQILEIYGKSDNCR